MSRPKAKQIMYAVMEEMAQDERKLIQIMDDMRQRASDLKIVSTALESDKTWRMAERIVGETDSIERLRLRLASIRRELEDIYAIVS